MKNYAGIMGGTQFAKKSKHRKHKQDILLKIQTLDCLVHYWTITQKIFMLASSIGLIPSKLKSGEKPFKCKEIMKDFDLKLCS